MTQRVLRTRVRVTGDDGQFVVLRAGDTVPEEYEDQITNPRCYVDTTSLEQPAEPVAPIPPAAEAGEGEPSLDEVKPIDVDELEEHVVDEEPEDEPEDESEPEKAPAEPEVVYSDLTVAELEDLLAERGLPQSGVKRELIARLKADDAK